MKTSASGKCHYSNLEKIIEIQIIVADISFLVPCFGLLVKSVEGLFMAHDRMTGVTKTPPMILGRLLGLRYNHYLYNFTWLFI